MSVVFPLYLKKRSKQPTSVQPVKTIIESAPVVVETPAPVVIKSAPVVVETPAPVVVEIPSHHDSISIKPTRYVIKNFSSITDRNVIKKRNI